jgi:large repetitive protein
MTRQDFVRLPAAAAAAALASLAVFAPPMQAGAPVGQALMTITPCRVFDTRNAPGPLGGPAVAPGETRVFPVAGTCNVPANALAIVGNLTAASPAATGIARLYAGDLASPPNTQVLAFTAGRTRAGNAFVALAANGSGTVALTNVSWAAVDFVLDVSGYFVPACTATIVVTDPATSDGAVNAAFSQTFTATGGTGALTFATASPLPAGLALSTAGVLSGTPTQPGTFPVTVVATDANGCTGTGATYTLVIACQTIAVTNPATATGTANAPFSQTFTASGGVGAVTFSTSSALPAGLTLSAAGVLSGTPTQAGGFDIVVTAKDSNGCTGSGATYHLVIGCQTISVTDPAVTAGTVSAPFSQQFTQTGAIGTATFTTASALPSGLTLSANGLLSGTPMQPGTFPVVVKVTDANVCTGAGATYNLTIGCQAIAVTSPATTAATAGTLFSQTFTQSGAVGTATFTTASALPAGLTLGTDGTLSGTPTQTGSFPIVVTVTDANGCAGFSATYTLVVGCQTFSVFPATIPQGTSGSAYAVTFTAPAGIGAVTFVQTGTLPNGISFSIDTLSGQPTETGSFPITVTATDSNGCTASRDYLLVVSCSGTSITLSPGALAAAPANAPFPSTQFTASGGTKPYTFQQAGVLPGGMQFLVDTLSGTPTKTGTYPITISATDASGCAGSQDYVVTITCNGVTIAVAPATLDPGPVGSPYGPVTFTPSGGSTPYTLLETGALPSGMTYAAGVLSGTPTQPGTFPVTVTATDANGCTGQTVYSLVTTCPTITVTNPGVTTGTAGVAFSQKFAQTGGSGTATFATSSALPTGLTLDADGTLHGTTSQTGTFPIVVKATDANGCTGTGTTYTLVINCQTITVTNPGVNTGTVDASFSQTFTATGLLGTATWSETGALPAGVTLDASTGTLSGSPAVTGSFPITVKATDANGCSATSSYTLTIACQTITVNKPAATAGTYNTAFSQSFTQTGAHGTATFTTPSALPAGLSLSTAGVLSGAPTQTGSFPVIVTVTDANGCTGTSATYALTVAPKLTAKAYTGVGNTQLAGGVVAPSTPSVGVVAVSSGDTSDTAIAYAVLTPPAHGTLTTFNANGTFLYTPNAGNTTADSFTYTGTSSGVSAAQTATIAFNGLVWYVDNAAGGSHDGRSNTPFTTMTDVGGAATNNGDFIYVAVGSGSTTGAYAMKPSQQLVGAGATLSVGGILTVTGSAANTPTLGGTITLANSVTVNGIDMNTGSSGAISGSSVTGISVTVRTVTTTTGTAVSIGGSGNTGALTFTSVSSDGAANGIRLQNLTGSFTVTGDGTNDHSGGTIQNTTGDGVLLSNSGTVSLTSMNIQGTAHSGVKGSGNVQTFSFVNGTINNSGTASGTGDSNIAFNAGAYSPTIGNEKNLSGTLTITGSTLTNAYYHGIDVFQFDGTITNVNISNNTLTSSTSTGSSKGSAIRLVGFGSASTVASFTKVTVNQNTITNFPSDAGILFLGGNSTSTGAPAGTYGTDLSTNPIAITNNVISGQSAANQMGTQGINTALNGRGTGFFVIANNSITNVKGLGIGFGSNGLTTYTGSITGNTIVAHNIFGSAGIGGGTTSTFSSTDTPVLNLSIGDGTPGGANDISQTNGNGILVNTIGATGQAHVRIRTNTVAAPTAASGTTYGIRVSSGNASSANETVCLEISGNTTAGDNDGAGTIAPGIGLRKQGTNPAVNAFGIVGLPGGSTSSPAVETYVNSQNPGSASGSFGVGGTALISATSGFSTCVEPGGF